MSADKRVRPALTNLSPDVEDTVRDRLLSSWDIAMDAFFRHLDTTADIHDVPPEEMRKLISHLLGEDVADEYEQWLTEGG